MERETLQVERRDGVGVVTLNRPAQLNTMNVTMRQELEGAFRELRDDPDVGALVITGAGSAFSAGGDVNDFAERDAEEMHVLMRELSHRWFGELWRLPKPTVAAVNGVAAGVGVSFALACDYVMATESASFLLAFSRIGLMPDGGDSIRIPACVAVPARLMPAM